MSVNTVPSWAKVGAEVVCITETWPDPVVLDIPMPPIHRLPMLNEVLVIREVIGPDAYAKFGLHPSGGCCLRFDISDWAFPVSNFRPVQSTAKPVSMESDIALFERIAEEVSQPLTTLTDALNLAWFVYGVEE